MYPALSRKNDPGGQNRLDMQAATGPRSIERHVVLCLPALSTWLAGLPLTGSVLPCPGCAREAPT